MLISDYFGWAWKTGNEVDVTKFQDVIDPRAIDWDLAIWGDPVVANWARAQKANRSSISVVPSSWLGLFATSPETYSSFLARVPYSVSRCAEVLAMASGHLVKTVDKGGSGEPAFASYDVGSGVWMQGTKEVNGLLLKILATDFAEAMNRAADFAMHLAEECLNVPQKPAANASGADKKKYAEDLATFKTLKGKAERIQKFERTLPSSGTQNSIKGFWRGLVVEDQSAWDSDMRWIVLKDCALDLDAILAGNGDPRTSYDVPHSPEHMSTMSLDVVWREYLARGGAEDSEWYTGVARALPDPDIRKYLQKRFGAALLGKPGAVSKSLVWQYGPSGAAKSTIQEIIAGSNGVLAPYSYVASSSVLTERGSAKGNTDRFKAYVRGKRLVLMDELRRGSYIMEDELKTLTGGNTVEGTAKFANAVSYNFTATIFIASNDPPTVPSGDKIAMSRIHVVPFNHVFYLKDDRPEEWAAASSDHRADPGWKDRVLGSETERAAVLAWVLDGLMLYASEGIGELPEVMKEARDEFQEDGKGLADRLLDYMLTGGDYDKPWITLMSDSEWEASGLRECDGLTTDRLRNLMAHAGTYSGLTDGKSNTKLENNVIANLNQMGGAKKRVAKDGKRPYAFTRVREEYSMTSFLAGNQPVV